MTRLIDADSIPWLVDGVGEIPVITKEEIDDMPTVDAVPVRHGKWKKIRGAINCSACKSSSWSMSFEDLVTSFNYCPNCGARMDEE